MSTDPLAAILAAVAALPKDANLRIAGILAMLSTLPEPRDPCPVCATKCAAHTLAMALRTWSPNAPDAHPEKPRGEPPTFVAGAGRDHVVRETFKLMADVLLDVADERPLDDVERRVLELIAPTLAAAVSRYTHPS